jgi:GMP synthase-like glutamine amidotransferase
MIASAFGQQVFPGTHERGWVQVYPAGNTGNPFFPKPHTVFQWHNETFDLPKEAVLLAQGNVIKNQAFRLGSALGVQHHPEVTKDIISRWAMELRPEEKEEMLRESEIYSEMNRKNCHRLVDQFLRSWFV